MLTPLLLAAAAAFTPTEIATSRAWVRPTPPGAPTAAAYVTVLNAGRKPDRLLSATSPDAARVELHRMDMAGGVMRMRSVTEGVEAPPGAPVSLQPGSGLHLMLIAPKRRLVAGDRVRLDLRFARAGAQSVVAPVQAQAPVR